MRKITRVGVDLAKRVLQVHAIDASGQRVTSRALQRDRFLSWCSLLSPGCLIAMEASSSAHHWARRLRAMGLEPASSLPTSSPFRLQGKTGLIPFNRFLARRESEDALNRADRR